MAKYIDVRESGGDLVILGNALVLPASDDSALPALGAMRYNPTTDAIEMYSSSGSWTATGSGSGSGGSSDPIPISQVTNLQTTLTGKASTVHVHAIADVTNLQTVLDGKANLGEGGSGSAAWGNITGTLTNQIDLRNALLGKAEFLHGHPISDIADLQITLNGKANTSHTHIIQDVTNLQTTLSGLQDQINNISGGASPPPGPTPPPSGGDPTDVTPPSIISGLTLTSEKVLQEDGSYKIKLVSVWNASLAADLNGYILAVKEGTGTFVEFLTGPTSTRYELWVSANTLYTANIRAFDRSGNRSVLSSEVAHTTLRDTDPPGPPINLAAIASFSNIFLSWTNPTVGDLAHVQVFENTVNNTGTATYLGTINAASGANGSYTRGGLAQNSLRYYWLKAVDTSGNTSTFSAVATATTGGVQTNELIGQIVAGQIADAAITVAKFAATIKPVEIVSSLPNTGLVEGRVVYLTSNKQLYRYDSTQWTASLPAGEITGQIIGTQITDGSIITAKLGANAVTADKIAANTITAGQIAADTITAGQIAAGAVSTSELAAGAVVASKISAGTITSNEIAANTITAGNIAASTITGNKIAASTILGNNIAAGTIAADNILAGTITGDKFNTGTSLPGTITIGSTGVSIGTVQTQAAGAGNPAAVINANSTIINAGKVDIFGNSTLSSWRDGGDNTKISGGSIASNTITANKLRIGNRGITTIGLEFYWTPGTDTINWTTGNIYYDDDNGAVQGVSIAASSSTMASYQFIYWVKGTTSLSATQDIGVAKAANNVHLASWWGGGNVVAHYGGTIINGDRIVSGTITADRLSAGVIIASTAQIGDLVVTSAKIANLTVGTGKIADNAITSTQVFTQAPNIGMSFWNANALSVTFPAGTVPAGARCILSVNLSGRKTGSNVDAYYITMEKYSYYSAYTETFYDYETGTTYTEEVPAGFSWQMLTGQSATMSFLSNSGNSQAWTFIDNSIDSTQASSDISYRISKTNRVSGNGIIELATLTALMGKK